MLPAGVENPPPLRWNSSPSCWETRPGPVDAHRVIHMAARTGTVEVDRRPPGGRGSSPGSSTSDTLHDATARRIAAHSIRRSRRLSDHAGDAHDAHHEAKNPGHDPSHGRPRAHTPRDHLSARSHRSSRPSTHLARADPRASVARWSASLQVGFGDDHVAVAPFDDALDGRIVVAWAHDELVGRLDGLLVLIEPNHDGMRAGGIVAFTDEWDWVVLRNTGLVFKPGAALVVLLVGLLVLLARASRVLPFSLTGRAYTAAVCSSVEVRAFGKCPVPCAPRSSGRAVVTGDHCFDRRGDGAGRSSDDDHRPQFQQHVDGPSDGRERVLH